MISISNFIKNKRNLIFLCLVIIILAASYFLFWRKDQGGLTNYKVSATGVTQTVSVSGETKASSYVDLAFDQSGVVAMVGAPVGGQVYQGQVLAGLDGGKARADVLAAEANADYQKAKLADSQVNLSDAEKTLDDNLRDAFTKADDAVHNNADKFFADPNSTSPRFSVFFYDGSKAVTFDTIDTNLKLDLSVSRANLNEVLKTWKTDLQNPVFLKDKTKAVSLTRERLFMIQDLLDKLSSAVNSFSTVYYQYRTTVDSLKDNISIARSNINGSIADLNTNENKWNTSRLNAATSNSGEVSTQSAQIKQAEADVLAKRAILAKLSLVAPISGVVTKQEAKVGEAVTAGEVVVSILNPDSFEVEANIPEINIGKIKVGQKTKITLDAFPGEVFSGEVFYIDPAETIVDGVVNYKIKVAFKDKDARFKNGLTANLSITTDSKDGVLTVPVYAVTTDKGVSTVKKYVDGKVVVTPVKLGIYGDNGLVEVVDGLKVGDSLEVEAQ